MCVRVLLVGLANMHVTSISPNLRYMYAFLFENEFVWCHGCLLGASSACTNRKQGVGV